MKVNKKKCGKKKKVKMKILRIVKTKLNNRIINVKITLIHKMLNLLNNLQ